MPLHILGALVVFGIGGVVLLVHLLRLSRSDGFADEEAAVGVLQRDYPAFPVSETLLSDDAAVAVFTGDAGAAVAAKLGAGALTRVLAPGEVRRCEDRGADLRLMMADFAAPTILIRCADDAKRTRIKSILEAGI